MDPDVQRRIGELVAELSAGLPGADDEVRTAAAESVAALRRLADVLERPTGAGASDG
jgi:hypothetical protein